MIDSQCGAHVMQRKLLRCRHAAEKLQPKRHRRDGDHVVELEAMYRHKRRKESFEKGAVDIAAEGGSDVAIL